MCSPLRLPAIAAVTPGWATFQASASWPIVMPSRSAIGRRPSTTPKTASSLVGDVQSPSPLRQSSIDSALARV